MKAPFKKPKWINGLHQKQSLVDMVTWVPKIYFCAFRLWTGYLYALSFFFVQDTVILAINSATAAKNFFERHMAARRNFAQFSIVCMYSLQDLVLGSHLLSSSIRFGLQYLMVYVVAFQVSYLHVATIGNICGFIVNFVLHYSSASP